MTLKRWHKIVLAVVLAAIALAIGATQPRERLAFGVVPAVAAIVMVFLAVEPTSAETRRKIDTVCGGAVVLGAAWMIAPWPILGWVSGMTFLVLAGYYISVMYRPPPTGQEPAGSQ